MSRRRGYQGGGISPRPRCCSRSLSKQKEHKNKKMNKERTMARKLLICPILMYLRYNSFCREDNNKEERTRPDELPF